MQEDDKRTSTKLAALKLMFSNGSRQRSALNARNKNAKLSVGTSNILPTHQFARIGQKKVIDNIGRFLGDAKQMPITS